MTLLEKHPELKPIYDAIEDGADIKGALDEIMEGCKKGGPDYHFVYCPECNTELLTWEILICPVCLSPDCKEV